MRLFNEAKSYVNQTNAVNKLRTELLGSGYTLDTVRWMIVVTTEGRYVPVIQGEEFIPLAHRGIGVI